MTITGATALATTIPTEMIKAMALEEARGFNVIAPLVFNDVMPLGTGKNWFMPILPTTAAAEVAEASDITAAARTTTEATAVIVEVGMSTDLTDVGQEQSVLNGQIELWARSHGRAIAQKITGDLAALFPALNGSTAVGTSGTNMTVANFLSALFTLDAADAPGQRRTVLHPIQVSDLFNAISSSTGTPFANLPELIREGKFPAGQPGAGFVGALFGIPVYQTTEVDAVNSAADRAGAMFVEEAMVIVRQRPLRVELERDASARLQEIVSTVTYGVAEMRDAFGVPIETDNA